MALFGKKKTAETKADDKVSETPKKISAATPVGSSIIKPRLTEKATIQAEKHHVYTFVVRGDANKRQVLADIKKQFKVTPRKVNMVTLHATTRLVRGKIGTFAGVKKAIVYLKKGDKIEFA